MLLKNLWCRMMSLRGCVAATAISCVLLLVACDGDNATSAPSNDGISDSEEIQSSSCSQMRSSSSLKTVSSSSSSKVESSSSVILSGDSHEESSSSSSTSLKSVSSSSNRSSSSSSSEMAKSSSSSKGEAKSSSSNQSSSSNEDNEIDGDRCWDMPKEAYLNPEIDYGSMTDSRDGQIYKTVKIGNQVWMAENLNYADSVKTPSLMGKNWCYANKAENCAVAGRLYTWAAAIDSVKLATDADNPQDCGYGKTCMLPAKVQGICPDGWHLPTKTEWETLFIEAGGESTAEKNLKSQNGWNISNGTDAFGFSAIPAGFGRTWFPEGFYFFYKGDYAFFWSATESIEYIGNIQAYSMELDYDYELENLDESYKAFAYSVRCLKDL